MDVIDGELENGDLNLLASFSSSSLTETKE